MVDGGRQVEPRPGGHRGREVGHGQALLEEPHKGLLARDRSQHPLDLLFQPGNSVIVVEDEDAVFRKMRKHALESLGREQETLDAEVGAAVRVRRIGQTIYDEIVPVCGGGNDVAMALLNGAHHVDAVDINAWVIAMGKQHHPLKPLISDRVTTYVADGREFLARPGGKYDLIVYGLPDSMFTNDRSNLRVESFIFTREAFESVRSRLSDDGVFVIYNYYRVPWLIEKIRGMLRDSFGQEPYVKQFLDEDGEPCLALPAALAVGPGLALPAATEAAMPSPATDDWPFLYLTGRVLPRPYVNALAGVGALSLRARGRERWRGCAGGRSRRGRDQRGEDGVLLATLFFMGVAFVLWRRGASSRSDSSSARRGGTTSSSSRPST